MKLALPCALSLRSKTEITDYRNVAGVVRTLRKWYVFSVERFGFGTESASDDSAVVAKVTRPPRPTSCCFDARMFF